MLDGPFAAMSNDADLFADPSDGGPSNVKLSLVLLRDVIENPQITKRAKACVDLATERGVFVHEISVADGTGSDSFIAFAQVVVRLDFATTYLALGLGINPSDIAPITSLKDRIAP
jgi:glucose/mannose-6-phosphate isomerase